MPLPKTKLIKTDDVPAALDKAIKGLEAIRATYVEPRTDISNHGGDEEYLNICRDSFGLCRELTHDLLAAAASQIGDPEKTYDVVHVKIMEGIDCEILEELSEKLASSYPDDDYPPRHTDHLIVRAGSVQ